MVTGLTMLDDPLDDLVRPVAHATLKVSQHFGQSELQRLLGSAYFGEKAALLLYIEASNSPLIITPLASTFLGRCEESSAEPVDINLAPYDDKARTVSRRHAVFHRAVHVIALEDLGSTNGTYVNGQRLTPHVSQVLHDQDELRLGNLHIRITFQYS